MGFVHLNVKTGFSFLEGALPMERLCGLAKDANMDAVAVTDRGNLHGAYEFYKNATQAGIKPILGCEINLLPEGVAIDDKSSRHDTYSLTLLASNNEGWRNLKELASKASIQGFYYVPRVDWETLFEHRQGLIALSGGLGGLISRNWHGWHGPRAKRRPSNTRFNEQAKEAAQKLVGLFEKECFYLEFQDTGLPEEPPFNEFLLSLRDDLKLPGVATNNCHYAEREDAEAQRYLMCIQYRSSIGRFDGPEYDGRYFKDEAAMRSGWFADHPDLIEASGNIAERCEVSMELGVNYLPPFPCKGGRSEDEELHFDSFEGLKSRLEELRQSATYDVDPAVYQKRLEHELGIISSMGFPGYFLIVQDFINWAKDHRIRVGPGRGSGAGSLVAWVLRITDLDPLPYDLLFERFLNPERVSMPDFDVDFCQERRGEVIQYVTDKYGVAHVGQIATFSRLGGKSVIKDVASVLEMPFAEVNDLTRNIPAFHEGLPVTLTPRMRANDEVSEQDGHLIGKADDVAAARKSWGLFEVSSQLLELRNSSSKFKKVFDIATRLEGLYRQAGTHAGGVVIGREVLTEYTPIFSTSSGGQAAQFNMEGVEDVGLVKFDFLGLKNLDIISYAEDLVNEQVETANAADDNARAELIAAFPHLRGCDPKHPLAKLDVDLVPLDHKQPYKLISAGDTNGIFQLESDGMKAMLVDLKPDCFEDIVAAVALYRPGPMDQIPDYIKRKHGRLAIEYPHPALIEVLAPTYGHMVYQEQVMQTAQIIGGYTLGGADILRRAMGKKKVEEMERQRLIFTEGAAKLHGLKKGDANKIFDVMEKFAGYGFNKSHAAAYAKISYQTAYLKQFHPVAFYFAQVKVQRNATDTVNKYKHEA
ncbi:MAG: DNA polymerase III subunit alpha, partial [Myxococcota bacterium]|nr:DNA polymerase III subunit alpha [Myxococcota bacterium]